MPHFVNPSERYYLSTSLKVMFTLLRLQPSLQFIDRTNMNTGTYLKRLVQYWQFPHFMLVRDPYKRLESFFRDKFRQVPEIKLNEYKQLQHCQQIFCPHLQIEQHDSPTVIRDKLLNVSFARFIELLPEVYRLDGHLRPQIMTTKIHYRGLPIARLKYDRILKIESPDDMRYLQDELRIDLSKKPNSTAAFKLTDSWSPHLRAIVNDLYQADFATFDYEMREK